MTNETIMPEHLNTRIPEYPSPFDDMAADYDEAFTHTTIGMLMRRAVWRRLDARFTAGDRVLELNCGTGEDALYLARRGVKVMATDVSAAMVETARRKAALAGLSGQIETRQLAIEELGSTGCRVSGVGCRESQEPLAAPDTLPTIPDTSDTRHPTPDTLFDGLLSNFGGLNCVADLSQAADRMAGCLRPGAMAVLCLMGPVCPWEWVWYLRQGKSRKAFRRLTRSGVEWRGLTIRYPGIRSMRRAFAPHFRLLRASAIGALVPPPYAEAWADRHMGLVKRLNDWERRWEAHWPLPLLADHYLLELERNA